MAVSSADDAAYKSALDTAGGVMERDEANGVPSSHVAAVVGKVLAARRVRRPGLGGQGGRTCRSPGQRLRPHRVFEAAAQSSLGVN